jgi:hypothetical protein
MWLIKKPKVPWVMRLPGGLRDQPGWVFIGTLAFLAGLSYLTGLAESTSITRVLDPKWLRVWGGCLCLAGGLVAVSSWVANKALERMSLRFLSLSFLVYMGWILAALPMTRAVFTVTMGLALVVLSEIRVGVLTAVLRVPEVLRSEEGRL